MGIVIPADSNCCQFDQVLVQSFIHTQSVYTQHRYPYELAKDLFYSGSLGVFSLFQMEGSTHWSIFAIDRGRYWIRGGSSKRIL